VFFIAFLLNIDDDPYGFLVLPFILLLAAIFTPIIVIGARVVYGKKRLSEKTSESIAQGFRSISITIAIFLVLIIGALIFDKFIGNSHEKIVGERMDECEDMGVSWYICSAVFASDYPLETCERHEEPECFAVYAWSQLNQKQCIENGSKFCQDSVKKYYQSLSEASKSNSLYGDLSCDSIAREYYGIPCEEYEEITTQTAPDEAQEDNRPFPRLETSAPAGGEFIKTGETPYSDQFVGFATVSGRVVQQQEGWLGEVIWFYPDEPSKNLLPSYVSDKDVPGFAVQKSNELTNTLEESFGLEYRPCKSPDSIVENIASGNITFEATYVALNIGETDSSTGIGVGRVISFKQDFVTECQD